MMNKRGQGLSMNIVIIAILALLVLLIVAVLFMGGIGNVFNKIRGFLQIGTAGKEMEFVREQCRLSCINAQGMSTSTAKASSAYCTTTYTIDYDDSGTIDEAESEFKCSGDYINIPCPGVRDICY